MPKQTAAASIQAAAALRIRTHATGPKQTAAGTTADPYLQQYGKVSEQRIEDRYPKQPTVVPKQTEAAAIQAAAAPKPRIGKPAKVPKQTARISSLTFDQLLASIKIVHDDDQGHALKLARVLPEQTAAAAIQPVVVPNKIKPATVPKQPAAAAIQPPEDRYWEDYGKVPKQPILVPKLTAAAAIQAAAALRIRTPATVPKQTARKGPMSKIYDQIRRLIVCSRRE